MGTSKVYVTVSNNNVIKKSMNYAQGIKIPKEDMEWTFEWMYLLYKMH